MFLFKKEVDLILKLTNLALVLWFIIATVMLYAQIVNLTMPGRIKPFSEYELVDCTYLNEETTCEDAYTQYKLNFKDTNYNSLKSVYINIGMVVIVGGTIYFINKKGFEGGK